MDHDHVQGHDHDSREEEEPNSDDASSAGGDAGNRYGSSGLGFEARFALRKAMAVTLAAARDAAMFAASARLAVQRAEVRAADLRARWQQDKVDRAKAQCDAQLRARKRSLLYEQALDSLRTSPPPSSSTTTSSATSSKPSSIQMTLLRDYSDVPGTMTTQPPPGSDHYHHHHHGTSQGGATATAAASSGTTSETGKQGVDLSSVISKVRIHQTAAAVDRSRRDQIEADKRIRRMMTQNRLMSTTRGKATGSVVAFGSRKKALPAASSAPSSAQWQATATATTTSKTTKAATLARNELKSITAVLKLWQPMPQQTTEQVVKTAAMKWKRKPTTTKNISPAIAAEGEGSEGGETVDACAVHHHHQRQRSFVAPSPSDSTTAVSLSFSPIAATAAAAGPKGFGYESDTSGGTAGVRLDGLSQSLQPLLPTGCNKPLSALPLKLPLSLTSPLMPATNLNLHMHQPRLQPTRMQTYKPGGDGASESETGHLPKRQNHSGDETRGNSIGSSMATPMQINMNKKPNTRKIRCVLGI
jgi:hypothetical protein